jgi:hypothetical protein
VRSFESHPYAGHKGWYYCGGSEPKIFLNYTNCCPRHALSNQFYFNPCAKPGSGSIGAATSRLLRNFLSALLKRNGRTEEILRASEPVDLIIVNRLDYKVLFAEVKASPLVTLPLAVCSERLTGEVDGVLVELSHTVTDNSLLYQKEAFILVPELTVTGGWKDSYYSIGNRLNFEDRHWGYRGLMSLLDNEPSFFKNYVSFWNSALNYYYPKKTETIYWLTNSSGAPIPRPEWWPKTRTGQGEGFESISDSKTSVGMDRTDDIKKGIYQVLKLGSEGKPVNSTWEFKVGIVSNIHAARHYDDYLKSLENLVWTNDSTGYAKRVADLPQNQDVYNLFDCIFALTQSRFRDSWIEHVLNFDQQW